MAEPVLVVHGVANRDREAFNATVRTLQSSLGSEWNLIPVWWADLGGVSENTADALPVIPGNTVVRSVESAPTVTPDSVDRLLSASSATPTVRTTAGGAEELILRGAQAAKGTAPSELVRSGEGTDAIGEAIREELPNTRILQHITDPDILEAVGRIIGTAAAEGTVSTEESSTNVLVRGGTTGPYGSGNESTGPYVGMGSTETRGRILDGIKNVSRRLVQEIDGLLGRTVENALGKVNQNLRANIADPFARFFGDIFAYQRNRERIHQRLWQAIAEHAPGYGTEEKPINVIAHSLGGVVVFDAAIMGTKDGQVVPEAKPQPLWIKAYVTFGSQASFFHILDRREELDVYQHGLPVALPPTIGRWTNLWNAMDLLAFTAGTVFRLSNGQPPRDMPVSDPISLLVEEKGWTHSIYWKTEELMQALRQTLVK